MIPEIGTPIEEVRMKFQICSQVSHNKPISKMLPPPKESIRKRMGKGALKVLKAPWKATNYVIVSLEKVDN